MFLEGSCCSNSRGEERWQKSIRLFLPRRRRFPYSEYKFSLPRPQRGRHHTTVYTTVYICTGCRSQLKSQCRSLQRFLLIYRGILFFQIKRQTRTKTFFFNIKIITQKKIYFFCIGLTMTFILSANNFSTKICLCSGLQV